MTIANLSSICSDYMLHPKKSSTEEDLSAATSTCRFDMTTKNGELQFKWILRGQAAWAEGHGSESKYTTSGVRACRLECGLRVL